MLKGDRGRLVLVSSEDEVERQHLSTIPGLSVPGRQDQAARSKVETRPGRLSEFSAHSRKLRERTHPGRGGTTFHFSLRFPAEFVMCGKKNKEDGGLKMLRPSVALVRRTVQQSVRETTLLPYIRRHFSNEMKRLRCSGILSNLVVMHPSMAGTYR